MSARNTAEHWGWVAKSLHWIIFLLIVAAWIAVEAHEGFPKDSPERALRMMLHKSFGLTVLFLVWLRLSWRLSGPVPAALPAPAWQQKAAGLVHAALYCLMIAMPVTALLASQLSGRTLSWFAVFEIPPLLAVNKEAAGIFMELHKEVLWPALVLLVAAHAGAALWHHLKMKDATLRRMLPFS